MNKNIEQIFSQWGRKERQLPDNNSVLKSQILNQAQPSSLPIKKHRPLPWLSFAFSGLAVLALLVTPFQPQVRTSTVPGFGVAEDMSLNYPEKQSIIYPPYPGNVPITDSREFLKRYYNSTIKTTDVREMADRVAGIVRTFDGRIDGLSTSKEYGYVTFVVSASKFESLKYEIRNLAGEKFFEENISFQNLLPEKQYIEKNISQIEATLSQLRSDRSNIVSAHNSIITGLNSQIGSVNNQLAAVRNDMAKHPDRKAELEAKERDLLNQKSSLQGRIYTENRSYNEKVVSLDSQIKNEENNLKNVQEQDKNLMDNVATVQGTVHLDRINIWQFIDEYLPGPFIFWIFIGAAICSYIWHRRRSNILQF